MFHRRRLMLASLLVLVLLVVSVPAALAQGGGGDKFVVGGNYTLNTGETLNGNLFVAGGNVELRSGSTVNGDVSVAGGSIRVAGHIRGNVNVIGGSVALTSTSEIGGDVDSIGGSVNRAAGAVIHGSIREGGRSFGPRPFVAPELPPRVVVPADRFPNSGPVAGLLNLLGRFFGAIGMGLLLAVIAVVVLLIAPKSTAQVAATAASQPALNFATGLLTLVLALLVGVPLLIACGLGLLVWLVAFIALLYGWFAVGLWVGQRLLNLLKVRTSSSVPEMALGVFLITWLAWVAPLCIGWLFGLVVGSIGVGAVLLTRFGTQPSGGLGSVGGGRPSGGGSGGTPLMPRSQPPSAPIQRQPGSTPAADISGAATSVAASGEAATKRANDAPTYSASTGGETAAVSGTRMAQDARWSTDTPASEVASREEGPSVSLEDLSAVKGITPEIAARLRAAGSSTLVALAISDPETLARQAAVDATLVREQDWVGQARRLLG